VSWTIEPDQAGSVLKFKWKESGGPPVNPPTRQVFGSQLLKGIFLDVSLKYLVEGLRCDIEVHLDANVSRSATLAVAGAPRRSASLPTR
jgi:two-component sensor histidine kinase